MTGLYRIDNECPKEILLEGESIRVAMVEKALRRNGIRASRNTNSNQFILVDEERGDYVFRIEGEKECRVTTIKELMDKVNYINLE